MVVSVWLLRWNIQIYLQLQFPVMVFHQTKRLSLRKVFAFQYKHTTVSKTCGLMQFPRWDSIKHWHRMTCNTSPFQPLDCVLLVWRQAFLSLAWEDNRLSYVSHVFWLFFKVLHYSSYCLFLCFLHCEIIIFTYQKFQITIFVTFWYLLFCYVLKQAKLWVGNVFGRVCLSICLSICMSICSDYNFRTASHRDFIFGMHIHFYHI